jgi:hypothetical protein
MESRLVYRVRQFWKTITATNNRIPDSTLSTCLTPTQIVLFRRMQPSEQLHAYQVYQKLVATGWEDRDLLSAALLHDVGKILYPLSPLDRVIIVLGKWLFPRRVPSWAGGTPSGLRRPFVVASNHPEWGAELAKKAHTSALTVEFILRHQDSPTNFPKSDTDKYLSALQAADNEN